MLLRLALAAALIVLGDAAAARAATEFCPARAAEAAPVGVDYGSPAMQYSYQLVALRPKTVDAAIIADTDHGWYRWNVSGVTLTATVRALSSAPYGIRPIPTFTEADSPRLLVAFPAAVVIRHLWIVAVQSEGQTAACDVPGFESAQDPAPPPGVATVTAASQAAVAVSSAPPFTIENCTQPFKAAAVTMAAEPDPSDASQDYGEPLAGWAAVALDPNGRIVDTWIYASNGPMQWRSDVLRAARRSKYSGAISYCRPVNGLVLFEGTLRPF